MIKKLAACIREYKLPSILAPIFVSLEVIMEVVIPYFMGQLLDKGINGGENGNGDMNYIIKTGIMLAVFCILSLIFGVLAGKYAAKASSGFAKNLRHDMFHKVQEYSFSNIDKFSISSLVTRLTTDVTNMQNSYQMIIRIAVRSPMMLIFSITMAFIKNRKLSLIFVCIIPFLALCLFVIIRHAHPIFERVFKTYDKLNRVVSENLHGIRVVKSFVRENREKEKFNETSGKIYSDFVSAEKLLAFNNPVMMFSAYASMLLISWFGAKMIVNANGAVGGMTTGDLFTMMTYSIQILMNLMMLSMIFVMLTMSRASGERICEVLSEESSIKNCDEPIYDIKDGSIEFDNVGFSYAGREDKLCLSGVNLKINSGETVGIIGSTGSSKSTFVQLIARLYDVTTGQLKVGGVDVRNYDIDSLRNEVAMVLQKNVLFSGTIKENLLWGNENADDEELIYACRLAQADSFIKELPDGYDTYIEQGGTNVSGGQKQRICIARSLLKKPKILILDDSTSAVDTKTDALIRRAFAESIPDTTKIIIAQRISSIENADKIIVLDGGKVVACGSHEELLGKNEIYTQVYNSQVKGGDDNG